MISTKLIWMLIVSIAIIAILTYLFYTEMIAMHHQSQHRFIEMDHSEIFCDDDDCDDYE